MCQEDFMGNTWEEHGHSPSGMHHSRLIPSLSLGCVPFLDTLPIHLTRPRFFFDQVKFLLVLLGSVSRFLSFLLTTTHHFNNSSLSHRVPFLPSRRNHSAMMILLDYQEFREYFRTLACRLMVKRSSRKTITMIGSQPLFIFLTIISSILSFL